MNKNHPLKPYQDYKDLAQGGTHMFILASVFKWAKIITPCHLPCVILITHQSLVTPERPELLG